MRPSTPTRTYEWTSLSKGEASETRRHQIFDTKEYSSTSPTGTPKRGFTCLPEVLTQMDQLLPLLRCESKTTTPVLSTCPLASAAINLSPLDWKALGISDGKEVNSSISWRRARSEEGMGGAMAKKGICK